MTATALSVCIPTYNFGRFIGATLESIVSQLTPDVEIVVLDGASTDDTAQVVGAFQARCPRLRYERLAARGGIDRDMARSLELAVGDYCWLFSSDDVMRPGALRRVLELLRSGSDLYLGRHTMCTLDMKVLGERDVLRAQALTTFDLGQAADRDRYFGLAQTTEAFFSFMGTLVVKRSRWAAVPLNETFVGSCWAHAARLFELMRTGLVVSYVPELLVDRRGDNDSFADRGMVNRYRIAIEGYHRIADAYCDPGTRQAYHVRRVVRTEYGPRMFMLARIRCWQDPQSESRELLDALARRAYVDVPFLGLFVRAAYSTFPGWLYAALRAVVRRRPQWLKRVNR